MSRVVRGCAAAEATPSMRADRTASVARMEFLPLSNDMFLNPTRMLFGCRGSVKRLDLHASSRLCGRCAFDLAAAAHVLRIGGKCVQRNLRDIGVIFCLGLESARRITNRRMRHAHPAI